MTLSNEAIQYAYDLGYGQKDVQCKLTEAEFIEVQQILLCKDNFTYTELNELEDELVEDIIAVINSYNLGAEFKSKLKDSTNG